MERLQAVRQEIARNLNAYDRGQAKRLIGKMSCEAMSQVLEQLSETPNNFCDATIGKCPRGIDELEYMNSIGERVTQSFAALKIDKTVVFDPIASQAANLHPKLQNDALQFFNDHLMLVFTVND